MISDLTPTSDGIFLTKELSRLILQQRADKKENDRNEKINRLLLLLGTGALLATAIALPNAGRVLKYFLPKKSDWNDWQEFNEGYLRKAIKRLDKLKVIRISERDGVGFVKLTDRGRKKIIRLGLETITIPVPSKWDKKWRVVFYDVVGKKNRTRDVFRHYLRGAGFYPLQASVYLHAYPCEREIEFLKYFLGIGAEVRIMIAEKIENDLEFRKYFGV